MLWQKDISCPNLSIFPDFCLVYPNFSTEKTIQNLLTYIVEYLK